MQKRYALILLAGMASFASADPLSLATEAGVNGTWTLGSDTETSFVGRLSLTFQSTSYSGFCTDATTHYFDGNQFTLSTTADPLFTPAVNPAKVGYLVNHHSQGAMSSDTGAALQLAIWDELYDTSPGDVTTGLFHVNVSDYNTSIVTQANAFLTEAATATGEDALWFRPTTEVRNQSFATAVPEPTTMAAVGLGLLAIARRRRKS